MEKSKVISARIKGKNLALFNQMKLSPTDLVNYALKEYSKNYFSPEKLNLTSQIHNTIADIHNYELELKNKRNLLKKLRKDFEVLEAKEYIDKRNQLMPLLKDKYYEDIQSGKVDCVEEFFKMEKEFIDFQAFTLKINQEILDEIILEFYNNESHQAEFDNLDFVHNTVLSDCSH